MDRSKALGAMSCGVASRDGEGRGGGGQKQVFSKLCVLLCFLRTGGRSDSDLT